MAHGSGTGARPRIQHLFNIYSTLRAAPGPKCHASGGGRNQAGAARGRELQRRAYISSEVVPEAIMGVMPRATNVACISLTESSIDTP